MLTMRYPLTSMSGRGAFIPTTGRVAWPPSLSIWTAPIACIGSNIACVTRMARGGANGRAYRIAGWHTDITERRARESQVKERERQYHDIFESTSDGLILNDLKTGRVVEANPAACAMHGYTHREFIGLHPTAFIMPENHEAFERYMQAAREGRPFRTHAIDVRKEGSL